MSAGTAPVFLAGVDRSGIGLLGELLDAHPDLAISRRTNFWSQYHNRFGDLRRSENLERCIAAMMESARIRALDPDLPELRRAFAAGEPTYGRLFAAIQEQNLRRLGKTRWGDKSLDAEGYADVIFREFPDARMVHVLRDPRDRYASQSLHRRASRGKLGAGTGLWLWSVRLADRNRRRHPGRYAVVRYEDLVTRPREQLEEICAFLGMEFRPRMLTLPPATPGSPGSQAQQRELTTRSVGRFHRDLSGTEVAFVDLLAGRRMAKLGYGTEPGALSPRERLAFAAWVLPVDLARMAVFGLRRHAPASRRLQPPRRGSPAAGPVSGVAHRGHAK